MEEARRVVEYAHKHDVTVEAELGKLAGVEDDVKVEDDKASVHRSGRGTGFCNSGPAWTPLPLQSAPATALTSSNPARSRSSRLDILEEVSNRLPGFPIVLHGASSVLPEFVQMVNQYGGQMPDAIGIPEEMLREAAANGSLQDQRGLRPPPRDDRNRPQVFCGESVPLRSPPVSGCCARRHPGPRGA